jgi:hypothetical protein
MIEAKFRLNAPPCFTLQWRNLSRLSETLWAAARFLRASRPGGYDRARSIDLTFLDGKCALGHAPEHGPQLHRLLRAYFSLEDRVSPLP